MAKLEIHQISSLEKVMPYQENFFVTNRITALKGERVSWQTAVRADKITPLFFSAKTELGSSLSVRRVEYVPVELAAYDDNHDDDFISHNAGIYPDILSPIEKNVIIAKPRMYTVLWITVEIPSDLPSGCYNVEFTFRDADGTTEAKTAFEIQVLNIAVQKPKLKYTQWLHTDCIADYYKCRVFSEEYWSMVEKFVEMAVHTGINMIYTPLFTPPLDTRYGCERTTVQLIGVTKLNNEYSFEFSKLDRWIKMCNSCGIKTFEFSHLFSQWGAKHTPKIIAETSCGCEQIFGWKTDSKSKEYAEFLHRFLPELIEFLKDKNSEFYFHISDEPTEDSIDCYSYGYNLVKSLIGDYKIIDAVSETSLMNYDITEYPVSVIQSAESFFDFNIKERWIYYSCACNKDVCNRYIAMPSYRNRAIGLQFYKYNIDGFLHWGYNFYNSGLSDIRINPFTVTDSYGLMPAGDAFSVYPAQNGPVESIRSAVFHDALSDLAACKLLESLSDKKSVLDIIEKYGGITFKSYPKSPEKLFDIRESVNKRIHELI